MGSPRSSSRLGKRAPKNSAWSTDTAEAAASSPGFYNTKTGRFGLIVRWQLRRNVRLRQWIKYTTLDCRDWGATTVKLKANPAPSRSELDWSILPAPSFPERRVAAKNANSPANWPMGHGCLAVG